VCVNTSGHHTSIIKAPILSHQWCLPAALKNSIGTPNDHSHSPFNWPKQAGRDKKNTMILSHPLGNLSGEAQFPPICTYFCTTLFLWKRCASSPGKWKKWSVPISRARIYSCKMRQTLTESESKCPRPHSRTQLMHK
jgi:hypothetical protein